MSQAGAHRDVMINKIDIIPDSLPWTGFLELRNKGCAGLRGGNRVIFPNLLGVPCPNL